MTTRRSVRAGFMGSAIHLPAATRRTHNTRRALRSALLRAWGSITAKVIAGDSKWRKREDQRKQELENDEYTEDTDKKLTRKRDWSCPSNPERRPSAASSFAFDASSEESDEDEYEGEYEVMGFSTSDVQLSHDCWERGER
ncbi:hypothetical protein BDR06DRAFT_1007148 [Suillus hirtellus]|nr:hypothetical protein BDR06DRAFT_1007148 [Suillus hirtellus]